ncbi:WD40 repeat-like protein [Exidia glandulosa HHB12029]|uniref:WD40 repeat-like protein n=1 Tax=Exidia glandulosa HHB12029 TaxID=1314781 RepID=A0A166BTK0_EXIGL|nr:WD40 repeat-like protein [Exidia glandulosa HHB12029]
MLGQRTPFRDASNAPAPRTGKKRNPFAQGGTPFKKQKLSPAPGNAPVPPAKPAPRELSTHVYRDSLARGASIRALRRPGARRRPVPPSSMPSLESFVSSKLSDSYPAFCLASRALSLSYSNEAKNGGPPTIAAGTVDGKICIWQPRKREVLEFAPQQHVFKVHSNMIRDLRWSPDDQYLASASADQFAAVTNATTGQVTYGLAHNVNVHVVAWDPNHQSILATVAKDHQVRIWDLRDKGLPKVAISPPMPSGSVNITSAVFLPHEPHRIVTSWSADGMLKKWDIRYHASASQDASPHIISLPCEETTLDPTVAPGSRPRGISNLLWNERAAAILGLSVNGRIYGYPTFFPSQPSFRPLTLGGPGSGKSSFFVRMAQSPCGRWVAAGSTLGVVHAYDIASGGGVVLQKHKDEVHGIDWASDGLALASDDMTVSVWRHDPEVAQTCREDPETMAWKWHWARREV